MRIPKKLRRLNNAATSSITRQTIERFRQHVERAIARGLEQGLVAWSQ